jgi:hypothetical protein
MATQRHVGSQAASAAYYILSAFQTGAQEKTLGCSRLPAVIMKETAEFIYVRQDEDEQNSSENGHMANLDPSKGNTNELYPSRTRQVMNGEKISGSNHKCIRRGNIKTTITLAKTDDC